MIIGLLLVVGIQLWLIVGHGLPPRDATLRYLAGVWIVLLIPPVRRALAAGLDRIRAPSPRARLLIAISISAAASFCFYMTALHQERAFHPYIQDEFCYVIQMRMLAMGRLWMQPHPLGEAFENFYLLHLPKYAAIYFPGTALLYVGAIWLKLPLWLAPLLAAGAVVAMTYRNVTELVDGVAGILAAALLASISVFRWLALRMMATVPVMLFGMLMLWAYLRWRKEQKRRWAVAIGIFAGWAAITRPLDALSYALPVGVVLLYELYSRRTPWKARFTTLFCIVGGAIPFLGLQLVFNKGVTGSWLYSPYQLYHDRDAPGAGFGFNTIAPDTHAQSALSQKQEFYEKNIKPTIQAHRFDRIGQMWREARLPMLVDVAFPHVFLLLLVPVGLVGLCTRQRWTMLGALPVFVLLYSAFTFFLPHYTVPLAPAVLLIVVLGAHGVAHTWPRARSYLTAAITASLIIIAASTWHESNRVVFDDLMGSSVFNAIKPRLDALPERRAIVLFRRGPHDLLELEPAYNPDAAWPDDARVIRAHDLGDKRNQALFDYYTNLQPDRVVYLFDRGNNTLLLWGNVATLARQGQASTQRATKSNLIHLPARR